MKRLSYLLMLGALATSGSAQATKYGPLALRLPGGARALAMGDIAVAGRDDDVIFYNPAQLAIARGTSMSVERMSPNAAGGSMSTVLRLGSGGLGLGVNYFEYRAAFGVYPISRDDVIDGQPGLPSGSSTLATVGLAQAVRGVRIGASANYAIDEVGVDRFRNVVADVGLATDFLNRFTAGLSLQHLGRAMGDNGSLVINSRDIKPPMKATLGVAWVGPMGPLDVTATAAISGMREGNLSPGIGGEASYSWLSGYAVSARAGVHHPYAIGDASYTGGVGFVADRVALDVAAEALRNNHVGYRVGFRIR